MLTFKGLYRKTHRRIKTYHSSYLSVIFPGLIIGIFFALVLNQKGLPKWEPNLGIWILYFIIGIFLLVLFYYFGKLICSDEKERKNFHNNYFINIFTTIPLFLLIVYNDWIKEDWTTILMTFFIFILYYFLTNHIYSKIAKS